MKRTPRSGHDKPVQTALSGPVPELPAWKAFVVQFSRDADGRAGSFAGRVEHLSSGQRTRFGSQEELLGFLTRLLAELGTEDGGTQEEK